MRKEATRTIKQWESQITDTPHADYSNITKIVNSAIAAWEIRRGIGVARLSNATSAQIEARVKRRSKMAREFNRSIKKKIKKK